MSNLNESKSPHLGKPSDLQSTQLGATHTLPQSVTDGSENSDPPPPEILCSISNREFPAWGEYLEKEKPKDYILWKLNMIGEGHQAMTNRNAGIGNQQLSKGLGIGEPSSSGSSSRLQQVAVGDAQGRSEARRDSGGQEEAPCLEEGEEN